MTHLPTPPEPADANPLRPAHALPFDDLGPLDDEELSEELTPEDEMWLAITDYVSGHATAEEAAAVETRITEDPEYAKLVAEVRAIWALPFDRILTGKGAAPVATVAPHPTTFEFPPAPSPEVPRADWRQRALWGAVAVAVAVVVALLAMRVLGR